ncbi:MAG: hypothetical protein AAF564_12755 [Bacteroidota bacterium]
MKGGKGGQGIGVGIALGVALGAAFDNVGLGLALGVAFGAAFDTMGYKFGRPKPTNESGSDDASQAASG